MSIELVSKKQFIDTYFTTSYLTGVDSGLYALKGPVLLVLLFCVALSFYWNASFSLIKKDSIHVGPWGGNGGRPWTFIPNGRITQLSIRSGFVVDAVCFRFTNRWGFTQQSHNFGGGNGGLHQVHFGQDEEIINISGSVGTFGGCTVITSLIFVTNSNTYGRYGTRMGTDFSLPVIKGKIIGFYGRHGKYLDSIGVVLAPEEETN